MICSSVAKSFAVVEAAMIAAVGRPCELEIDRRARRGSSSTAKHTSAGAMTRSRCTNSRTVRPLRDAREEQPDERREGDPPGPVEGRPAGLPAEQAPAECRRRTAPAISASSPGAGEIAVKAVGKRLPRTPLRASPTDRCSLAYDRRRCRRPAGSERKASGSEATKASPRPAGRRPRRTASRKFTT